MIDKKTNKNKYIIKLILAISLIIATLVFATIFDLSISRKICILPFGEYFSSNVFVIICEVFGESILYVLLLIAFSIIFNYYLKKQPNKKFVRLFILILCAILGLAISLMFIFKTLEHYSYYASKRFINYYESTLGKVCFVLFSCVIEIIVFLIFNKLKADTLKSLFKWAVIIIVVSALSNGLVKLLKIIFKRTRFRAMLYVGDVNFNYYTNWFVINKNTFPSLVSFGEDFFKSFPSGHACAASSIFFLCLLPSCLNKFNKKSWKATFIIISTVYTFLICFSRVLCGAHFVSDVLIGAFITILTMFLLNLLYKNFLYKFFNKLENL